MSGVGSFYISASAGHQRRADMIRYSCDLCKRALDPQDDLRYVVKIEVYAAFDPSAAGADEEDRDNLEEIQDILERLEDSASESIGDDV